MTVIEDFQRQVSGAVAGNLEAELHRALRSVEDREWTAAEAKARTKLVVFGAGANRVTEFRVDNEAVLEIYPETVETKQTGSSYVMTVTQNYRRLYDAPTSGDQP